MNTRVCVHCNKTFAKIKVPGKFIRYKTEDGRYWSGKACPDCQNAKKREYYAKQDERRRKNGRPSHYAYYYTKRTKLRPCQKCGIKNHNYYYCPPCTNELKISRPNAFEEAVFMSMYGVV